ncbi:MAG: molybdenum cofactor guanylyltransferase [Chthoniobacterales bacterium]
MNFSAVLLCGGQSRRMRRDKALVEWNDVALWQTQLATLRGLQPKTTFLSAREDKPWRPPDVKLVLDGADPRGPISGITAVLRACETTHLVVLAIDLPLMTSAYLRRMIGHASPACGIVPRIADRFEPACAIYPRQCVEAFDRGAASLQVLIAELIARGYIEALDVQPDERDLFKNVNEPSDLAASSVAQV